MRPGDTADCKWAEYSFSSGTVGMTVHILIVSVTGTQVVINRTDYNSDGAIANRGQLTIDVSTRSSLVGDPPFLIAPGLQKGDPIYSGISETINDTRWENVGGGRRKCNDYVEYVGSYDNYTYSWDQATGLMFHLQESSNFMEPFSFHLNEMELTATSLWSPSTIPVPLLVGGGLAVVLVVAAAIIISKRMKSRGEPLVRPEVEATEPAAIPPIRHCMRCGADLEDNALHCLMCGEPVYGDQLREKLETTSQPVHRTRPNPNLIGQKCMVCALPVKKGEELLRCPHCRNIAHKTHMLEWLHVHHNCPVCNRHIEEFSLSTLWT